MKNILAAAAVLLSFTVVAQTGWRDREMEVSIRLEHAQEAEILRRLHLNGDVYPDGTGWLYLVPEELEKLEATGISYTIAKENLNEYFRGFWDERVEGYHSYQDIIDLADSLAQYFPDICQKTVHGYSVQGRQLASLKISDNASVNEPEPEVWFDGGIHGDEIGASENVIRFARDLCLGYGTDPVITSLVDTREIWLYLMVNPDGRVNMTRYNAYGVDLNRDWGYMWDGWGGSPEPYSQVETKIMRDQMLSLQASVSISYHSGIELALYPWGYRYSQANDDPHLSFLANHYSDVSGYNDLEAQQSVMLYPVNGSTTDMCYGVMGSGSLTVEISNSKQPPVGQLLYYYQINYPSMIAMIECSGYGIGGMVTDAQTGNPVEAAIYVNDYYPTFSDPDAGDFQKFVLPGTYSIRVEANGYETEVTENIVVYPDSSTFIELEMVPSENQYAFQVITVQIPDNNPADEGYTPGALGEPDEINYSLGKNGWIVVDMQQTILDGSGDEITIYEGDVTPETYTCFASDSPDGPWDLIGTGTGTAYFDFAEGMVPQARYIKILDDGDGTGSSNNAGFDLDAVDVIPHLPGIHLTLLAFDLDDSEGNGDGYLDPGERAYLLFTLRNNGDVTAENCQATLSTDQLFVTIDSASASLGDMAFGESVSGRFTITANLLTPVGYLFPLLMNVEANGGNYTCGFDFDMSVGNIGEDWETGGFDKFAWESGGAAPWLITESDVYEGTYAARSGSIFNNAFSELSLTLDIMADGLITFYRKVSSEPGYDFLEFRIDDILAERWSGEVGWEQVTYEVNQGSHTFSWIYTKDVYAISGSDCGWIDLIQFPPIQPTDLGTLTGTVTDLATGLALEGVSISGVALTDSDGAYSIDLSEGTYEICASLEGYETLCQEVTVLSGQVNLLDFMLVASTSIEKWAGENRQVRVYPNPSSGMVTFEFVLPDKATIMLEIYSFTGEQVFQNMAVLLPKGKQFLQWDGTDANGNLFPPGIYTGIMHSGNETFSFKFLRQ